MTEQEWLECTDPTPMMEFLRHSTKHRSFRLLACASCRRFWELLVDERSRRVIEVTEEFEDRNVDQNVLRDAAAAAYDACCQMILAVDQHPAYALPHLEKYHEVAAFAALDASNANNFVDVNSVVVNLGDVLYGEGIGTGSTFWRF